MAKSTQISKIVVLAFIVSGFVFIPAYAISDNAGGTNSQSGSSSSESGQSNQSSGNSDSSGGSSSSTSGQSENSASGKLSDEKKQICEQNANRVQSMFTNMNQLGEGQYELFNGIAEKVQNYYTENSLNIDNYEELIGEVERTREQAQIAVQATVQTSSMFGCDQDDPKGTANEYKVQVKSQISTLKEFKTAVKNLLLAVKTAAQQANGQEQ